MAAEANTVSDVDTSSQRYFIAIFHTDNQLT